MSSNSGRMDKKKDEVDGVTQGGIEDLVNQMDQATNELDDSLKDINLGNDPYGEQSNVNAGKKQKNNGNQSEEDKFISKLAKTVKAGRSNLLKIDYTNKVKVTDATFTRWVEHMH